MITLTKLDDTQILVPFGSIKYIEKTPDTLIFFLNGDKILVRESLDDIKAKQLECQAKIQALAQKQISHPLKSSPQNP